MNRPRDRCFFRAVDASPPWHLHYACENICHFFPSINCVFDAAGRHLRRDRFCISVRSRFPPGRGMVSVASRIVSVLFSDLTYSVRPRWSLGTGSTTALLQRRLHSSGEAQPPSHPNFRPLSAHHVGYGWCPCCQLPSLGSSFSGRGRLRGTRRPRASPFPQEFFRWPSEGHSIQENSVPSLAGTPRARGPVQTRQIVPFD